MASMSKSNSKINIDIKEAGRLFKIANDFSDAIENFLESKGSYSREFLADLKLSIKQAKAGNLRKITSLAEI
jgi:hypothetical protein